MTIEIKTYNERLKDFRKEVIDSMDKDEYERVWMPEHAIGTLYWTDGSEVNNPEYFNDWELQSLTTDSLCELADGLML